MRDAPDLKRSVYHVESRRLRFCGLSSVGMGLCQFHGRGTAKPERASHPPTILTVSLS